MIKEDKRIRCGDIVKYFKRETLNSKELATNQYLYCVKNITEHTETRDLFVVYQALYAPFKIYARPIEMFCSEVNHEKYPNINQKYRFEKYNEYSSFDNKENGKVRKCALGYIVKDDNKPTECHKDDKFLVETCEECFGCKDDFEIDLIDKAIESARCRIYRLKEHECGTLEHQKKIKNQKELMQITIEALEFYKENANWN